MAKISWYRFRTTKTPNMLDVQKFNEDDEHQGTYQLILNNDKPSTCNCWAGHKWCRHKKMHEIFTTNRAIDSGAAYCFETGKWKEAIKISMD